MVLALAEGITRIVDRLSRVDKSRQGAGPISGML
jgi:hypothetical protein